jgi:16S rRNA (guanine966-N2)-methyltransferase
MRIIAGSAKGKKLFSPEDERVRPTSDRAREGLFSSLESAYGSLNDLYFLDLFAGSGAVGIEALSRGAEIVHAVEDEVSDLTSSNFALINGASGKYKVFKNRAKRFLESDAAVKYDIIFMDPPYELSNEEITELLEIIKERNLIQPRGIITIERRSKSEPFGWPEGMACEKVRSYGQGSMFYGGYSASVLP